MLLTLLVALGCSKDEEAAAQEGGGPPPGGEASSGGEPATMPAENTEPTEESGGTTASATPQVNPNLPVGKQRKWTYATGKKYDLNLYYQNKPVNVLTNDLGMPSGTQASGQLGIWFYDKMKVNYQRTNYTKINVIVGQGRVVKVTIDKRSAKAGGEEGTEEGTEEGAGGAARPVGRPAVKGAIDPTTGLPFKK